MTHSRLPTPAPTPPESLVALAQGGDRRALEQLIARHGPVDLLVLLLDRRLGERCVRAALWS